MAWTALAAWQQSVIFNLPPLITINELDCNFPCLIEVWEARSTSDFENALRSRTVARSSLVRECFDALTREQWSGPEQFPLNPATPSDMQILISGKLMRNVLQTMLIRLKGLSSSVLSANLMGTVSLCTSMFDRAFSRCQKLWDSIIEELLICDTCTSRTGNAFLLFARRVVGAMSASEGEKMPYLSEVGHHSAAEIHEFLKRCVGIGSQT